MAKQEETFTKIPNIILDDTTLNVYERAILIHIARQTIGYGKKSDGISLSQFVKATGISKAKVIRTIEDVKKKKLLKVIKQTAASGGKSYNRYYLTLVSHKDYLVSDRDYPSISQTLPLVSDRDIQKKIEQKKIDKKRETETYDNIFFSLSDHEQTREANSFAEHISMSASNPEAYKVKIKKQINKEHPETLEVFQEWYFTKTCQKLSSKYVGEIIDGYRIESIYPYTDTKGYADSSDYEKDGIYFAQGRNTKGETRTWWSDTDKRLDRYLENLTIEVMQ